MNPVEYTSNVKAPHLCDLRQPRLSGKVDETNQVEGVDTIDSSINPSLGINSDALLGGLDYLIVQYEDKCPHNRAPHEPTSLVEALRDFSVGPMNSKEALLNQLHSYLLLLLNDQINTLSLSLIWDQYLLRVEPTISTSAAQKLFRSPSSRSDLITYEKERDWLGSPPNSTDDDSQVIASLINPSTETHWAEENVTKFRQIIWLDQQYKSRSYQVIETLDESDTVPAFFLEMFSDQIESLLDEPI
ncbi:hypothetical protein PSHT_13087 [Puccinia striiformis]|uniref:Uncharacterized protein n=1 Tax=Puccinia striiformis TaxID=27350 RepID=A0A2S4USQ8_9BASI|nr:hypothetical protein PSHT_13087 [Puccinia striiformis]